MSNFPIFLSIILAIPLVGFVVILFIPRQNEVTIKWAALVFSLAAFIVSLYLLGVPFGQDGSLQWLGRVPWIPSAGISFAMGVDGLSIWLVLLTTLLSPIASRVRERRAQTESSDWKCRQVCCFATSRRDASR